MRANNATSTDATGFHSVFQRTQYSSPLPSISGILEIFYYNQICQELYLIDSESSCEEETMDCDEEFRRRLLRIEKENFLKVKC